MDNITIRFPTPYDWQEKVLNAPQRHRLICASRQSGKTEVAKRIVVEAALHGLECMWISPTYRQFIKKLKQILKICGKAVESYKTTAPAHITLITGGRIDFCSTDSPDSMRSETLDLVVSDEHAFGRTDAFAIVEPILKRRHGRFVAISTPNGMSNHYYELYENALKDPETWYVVKLPWHECPDFDPGEMEKTRNTMSNSFFLQEYEAEFMSPSGSRFNALHLMPSKIFVDEMPKSPQRKMIGVDWCTGKSLIYGDYHAISYVQMKDNMLYVDCHLEKCSIPEIMPKIKIMHDRYFPEAIAFESNTFQSVAVDNFAKMFPLVNVLPIIQSTRESKEERIDRLGARLERGQIKILRNHGGELLHRQLCDFGTKAHDDGPDSLELAIRAMQIRKS